MDAEDDDFQIDNKPYRLKSTQNTTQPPKNQPKRKISKQGTKNTSKISEPTKASETVSIDLTLDSSFVSSTQSTKVVKKRKIADPNLETTNRKKNWRNVPPKNQPLITEMFSKLNMSMSKEGTLDLGKPICSSTPKKTDPTATENGPLKSKQCQIASSPKQAIENANLKEANKESNSIVVIPDEDSIVCLADNNIKVHPSVTIKKPMEVVGCKNEKPKPKRKEISLKSQPKPPKNSNSNNSATKKPELIKNKNNIIFTNQVNVKSLVSSVNKANQKCAPQQQVRTIGNNFNLPSCITVIPTSQTNSSIALVQTKPKPLALRIRNPEEINKMKRTLPIKKQPVPETNKILPCKQQNTLKPKSSNQNKSITKKQNINTNNKATNKEVNQGVKRAATDNISPKIATPSKIAKLGNDKSEVVNKKTLVANEKNANLSIAKKIALSVPQSLQKSSKPTEAPKNRPTIFQERQNLPDNENPIPSTSTGITQCTSSSSNIVSSHHTSNKLINKNPIQNSSTDKANPIEKANVEIDNNTSTVNKKTLVVKEKNVNLSNVKKIAPSVPQSLQKSSNPSEAPKNRPTIFQERQNLPDIDNPIPLTSTGITQCTSSSSNILSSHQTSNKLINQNPIQNSSADKANHDKKANHKSNNNTTSANKEHVDENNSTPDTTQPFVVIPDTTVLDIKNTSAIMVEKVDIDHKARKRFSRIFGKLQDVNVKKESREDDLMIDNPNDFEKSASAAFGIVYSRKLESNADIENSTSNLPDMDIDEHYESYDEFEAKWNPIDNPTDKGDDSNSATDNGDDSNSPIIVNACSDLLNSGNIIKVDLHCDIPKVHAHNDDMMKYEVCDRVEPVNTSNDEIPVQRKPSEKVQVKVKDRVYDISLEPSPTNSQTMNDDAEPTVMVNDEDNSSRQTQEKQVDTEGPLPHAYDVVLQMVQGLQLSVPVLTTDMLLGEVKKILENRSSADLRIGDEYIVRFDLKEP